MKALSIAVMALLGQVSAITLKNAAGQEQAAEEMLDEARPDDTILLQTETDFSRRQQQSAATRLRANLGVRGKDNLYPATKDGVEWYELDHNDERIHGSVRFEETDDQSPHDPDVVDAPEDMKRVGNDHEELHNAKLSPDGYYNGYFHKDYEGNYVQKKSRHHRHHLENDAQMVQIQDHDNDSDDIPYSYEADGARAIPRENQSDYDLVQIHSKLRMKDGDSKDWSAYLQHSGNQALAEQKTLNEDMEKIYAQEEDEGSYQFVQLSNDLSFNHKGDTDDIPDDPYYDPVELHKKGSRRVGQPFFDKQSYLAQQKENKLEGDKEEVEVLMKEQAEEDKQEMSELTKKANDRQLIETESEQSQQEREEKMDVNKQITEFARS